MVTALVVVPIKQPGARKSRLAGVLDAAVREELAQAMFQHVLAVISSLPEVTPLVLSPQRPIGWGGSWRADEGELNTMLERMRGELPHQTFAVVNGDLPLLSIEDVAVLLRLAGEEHVAIAPDRHGIGTNAVALAPYRHIHFCFGASSQARFRAEAGSWARVLRRSGLAMDIDGPEDLLMLRRWV